MSTTEIFVSLFGLFLGYWVIAKLLGNTTTTEAKQNNSTNTSEEDLPVVQSNNWHEVLKVSPNASTYEIHAAYQSLISQYHPDKVAHMGEEIRALAESKSKAINMAYTQALLAQNK